jgi:hypothetical protein
MKPVLKPLSIVLVVAAIAALPVIQAFKSPVITKAETTPESVACAKPAPAGCIFKTLLGMEYFDPATVTHSSELTEKAIERGMEWIIKAQAGNGGWGAGSHSHQDIRDPKAVPADPATTALVGMALLRNSHTPTSGKYSEELNKAVNYLLLSVENSPENAPNITDLTNTQPQTKLGRNIDVILAVQFFTNVLRYTKNDEALTQRIKKSLDKCVTKIQRGQDADGGWKDGGWAPVLQSALANNSLEAARDAGVKIDSAVMERSLSYQNMNYDVKTESALTGKAAGVMLYSVSSSSRASAKEARRAKEKIKQAQTQGTLKKDDAVTEDNLVKAGMTRPEAQKAITAYQVNVSATRKAQDDGVMNGFGSNGGEEFVSYLMTGESLAMSAGSNNEWKTWFEKMTGRMIQIQNNDGSWNGHHCITSPVFCTATCLLILSIDKDMEFLVKMK